MIRRLMRLLDRVDRALGIEDDDDFEVWEPFFHREGPPRWDGGPRHIRVLRPGPFDGDAS